MRFENDDQRRDWINEQLNREIDKPSHWVSEKEDTKTLPSQKRFIRWIIQRRPPAHIYGRNWSKHIVSLQRYPITYHDLEQIGQDALIRAAEQYDPDAGAQFSTYAYYKIHGAFIDEFKGENEREDIKDEVARSRRLYEEKTEGKVKREILEIKDLDDTNNKILRLRIDGKKQKEIAEKMGLSQGTISKRLAKIKELIAEKNLGIFPRILNLSQSQHGHLAPDHDAPGEDSDLEVRSKYNDDAPLSTYKATRARGRVADKNKYPAGVKFYLTYSFNKEYDPDESKIDYQEPSAVGTIIYRPEDNTYYKLPKRTETINEKEEADTTFPHYPAWRICPLCFEEFKVKTRRSPKKICKKCGKNTPLNRLRSFLIEFLTVKTQ